MTLLYFLLQSSGGMVATAIVTGLVSGGSSAALIALISRGVGNASGLGTSAMWGFLGLMLVAICASIVSQMVLIRLSQAAVFKLRMHLSRQILASELSHLEQLGKPRLLATLTEDVQAVSDAVQTMPFLCIDIAIVFGCLSYLAWLYWSLFLAVLVLMGIGVGSCQFLLTRGWRRQALVREQQDTLYQHFRSLTEGSKEFKLHYQRQQDFLENDLRSTADAFRRNSIRTLTLFAATSTWGQFLLFFVIGVMLFVLPNLIQIPPQAVAGYVLTFVYLLLPIDDLFNNLPRLSRASVALQKIESLGLSLGKTTAQKHHGTSPTTSDCSKTIAPPNLNWQRLELKGVTYPYHGQDDSFVLGAIDLTLKPGEIVFIVGGNGSGKSTLAKLITSLYVPESGEIWLDDQPIDAQNRDWYRQHFAAIFADFYLFDRLLGLSDLDAQAKTYLEQLQLDRKVKIENGRLSTTALSQGQRKRLALLTAYLEDRPIYLFDEWAADQDPVFKELFYTQFLPQLRDRGKTILVISHDDHYFHVADRIIKLDYGKLEYDKQRH